MDEEVFYNSLRRRERTSDVLCFFFLIFVSGGETTPERFSKRIRPSSDRRQADLNGTDLRREGTSAIKIGEMTPTLASVVRIRWR